MQKRLRDREKETELDERDRKREKEELEEIRQRLLAEGHPDPDAELQRVRRSFSSVLFGDQQADILTAMYTRNHSRVKQNI